MRNLTEQVNRIKSLMLIKEQCGGDLSKCEEDLEGQGYKVFNPTETASSCDNNENIKCVKEGLSSVASNLSVSSAGNSIDDCFVLAKSKHKTSGVPTFHFTFYSDGQVILTFLLNTINDNKKLFYRSKYECDGTNINIKGGSGTFKYLGVVKGTSVKWENDIFQKDSGGSSVDVVINSSESASMSIPEGGLKYGDTLTYYLNGKGLYSGNVLDRGMTINNILDIIQHT